MMDVFANYIKKNTHFEVRKLSKARYEVADAQVKILLQFRQGKLQFMEVAHLSKNNTITPNTISDWLDVISVAKLMMQKDKD